MQPRRVAQLSTEDAAYLAGLIDGEGTVALTRRHAGENRQLVLAVSSTERALVEWARQTLGVGKITRKVAASPHHAPGLTYCVSNRQALDVLAQVAPFLRSYKRDRARLVLRYYLALTPRNGRYTAELLAERARLEANFAALAVRRKPRDHDVLSPAQARVQRHGRHQVRDAAVGSHDRYDTITTRAQQSRRPLPVDPR